MKPNRRCARAIAEALGRYAYLASTASIDEDLARRVRGTLLDLYYSDEQAATRKRALESVAYFSDDVEIEDAIAEAFDSVLHDMRIGAIFAMGRNLSERWFSTVIGEMQDSDPEVRFEAARASGEFGDERAVSLLLDLIDDEDPEVRMAAVGALGQIGGKVALGALRRLGPLGRPDRERRGSGFAWPSYESPMIRSVLHRDGCPTYPADVLIR